MFDSLKDEARKRKEERKEIVAAIEKEKDAIKKKRDNQDKNFFRKKVKAVDVISSKIEENQDEKRIEKFTKAQEEKVEKARAERRQQMTNNNKGKIIIGAGIVVITIIAAIFIFGGAGGDHEGQAKTPSGSIIQEGRMYEEVIKDFEDRGFTNVKTEKIEDLIAGWLSQDGEVERVTVGGDEDYSSDQWVPADTEVIIYYHTFPEEETITEPATESEEGNIEDEEEYKKEDFAEHKKKQKNAPIELEDGHDLLQSFYIQTKYGESRRETIKRAEECGLYTYSYYHAADISMLQIAAAPAYDHEEYDAEEYKFTCDSIYISYDGGAEGHSDLEMRELRYLFGGTDIYVNGYENYSVGEGLYGTPEGVKDGPMSASEAIKEAERIIQ